MYFSVSEFLKMLNEREPITIKPIQKIQNHKYKTYRLHNKVALITAGTMGIGLSTAERLAHEGACVVVSSRKQQNVDQAVQHLISMGIAEERVAGNCESILKVLIQFYFRSNLPCRFCD